MSTYTDEVVVASGNAKWFGIMTIVLGLLAIAAPLVAGAWVALVVGFLVLGGGVARMLWAFQAISFGRGLLGFFIGLLTLLCGIALVTDPLLASGALTMVLAFYFLIDGIFEIAAAFQIRPVSGWGSLFFGGVLSVILGVMIWQQFPLSGAWAIGILLGIKLLFVGIIMVNIGVPKTPPYQQALSE